VGVRLRGCGRIAAGTLFKGKSACLESGDDLLPSSDGDKDVITKVSGDEEDTDASQSQRRRQFQYALTGIKTLAINLHDNIVVRSD